MTRRPCPELSKESGAAARTACACLAAAGIAWVSFGSNIPSGSPSNSPNDSPSGSPGDTEAQPSDGQLWQTVKRRWWQELPDTPSAPTVEPAPPESLLVTWEAPDSTTDITAYHVEFRAHDPSGSTVRNPVGSETGTTDTIITIDTTVTIDGLMPSMLYHVRVRAVNDAGPGDWSVAGMGMTDNAAPVFLEGDATTRTLPENSPGAYEIGAPVAASDADGDTLTYALGGADAQAFAIDASTGQLATRPDYSYDHEANPSHELAVTATDGRGNQAEIALTVHVADVLEPPLPPDPPTVAPTGTDALAVSWTAPPNAGRPDITRYNLRYRGSSGPFTLWHETPTRTRAQITGLREDRYEVQVRGVNDEGDGAWSASGHGTINRPPNLVVNTVRVDDANPDPGETFTLSATVTNAGAGESPATTLRYYRSTDATITRSDAQVGTDAVSALSASGTSAASISLSAPAGAGTYYYGACVDAVADESNTADNCSSAVRVDVATPNRPPNLVVNTVRVDDANPDPGETFTLSATVTNAGAGESPATTLRYYRSTDATITRSDAQVGTDAVGALSASGTSAASISLSAPAGAGTYYYGACVDAVAAESNTADNCSSAVRVDVATPNRPPNLVVNTVRVDDANPDPGETFTLSATVANTGAGESPATTLRYYRSTDATITRSDAQVGTDAVGALSASGTSAASISLSAPAGAGTYYYGACVDAVAAESNTADNCSSAVRVDVATPNRPPNLVVNTLTVDDANLDPGETFTLSATVANTGAGESPATTLRYYRSTDATITRSDAQVGADAVGALSASGTSAASISLSALAGAGTYYYGACVDAVADESDTADNCSSSVRVDVATAPPVFLEGRATTRTLPENSPGAHEIGAPVAATDANGDTLTYGLGGTDARAFSVNASTGQLATRSNHSYDHEADPSHQLAVTANDGRGNQAEIAVTVHVSDVLEPPLRPDAPAVASNNVDTLAVFWTAPPNAGRPDITGYNLRYKGSGGSFTLWSGTPSGTRAEITGLQADSYEVQVRGVNDEGNGAWSASGHATIVAKPTPNLVVNAVTITDANLDHGETFRMSASVKNVGKSGSQTTMLRYYRSTDATISRSDAQVAAEVMFPLPPSRTLTNFHTLSASRMGTHYYGACVDAVADESDTSDNCSSSVRVDVVRSTAPDPGFDIDIVFVDPVPSSAIRGAVNDAAAVWEGAITSDLADMDFSGNPRNDACTDGEFAGFVDDLLVYVYFVDMDGSGGATAAANYCTARTATGTPAIGFIRLDSSDVRYLGTTTVKNIAVHELAHVLGFGTRWTVRNPSRGVGQPPPDTHWPGANAVAAFDAAGGTKYQGGKVPVENEHGGSASLNGHWRLSVMPGEMMTYNLDGTALSAITIQAMADLGYTVNAGAADSYSISSTVKRFPSVTAAHGFPLRCQIDPLPVEYVPEASAASP